MIDLGDELASYGDQPQTPSTPPDGMGSFGKLADLQAGGFDIDPRRTDADSRQWGFNRGLGSLTISVKPLVSDTWITRIAAGAAGVTMPTPNDGFKPTGSISDDGIEMKTWFPGDPE
jgi:hypothetical protein